MAVVQTSEGARWELYRALSEPVRLRLVALSAEEELTIGELADLLGERQPNISKHVKPLRRSSVLRVRREGTRALVSLEKGAANDPVVRDALEAGRALCRDDGSLSRVESVIRARDAHSREFFAQSRERSLDAWPSELAVYLTALSPLLSRRGLAVDAGTGDGTLLEVLAPVFDRVVACDRSEPQLAAAERRGRRRGWDNVTLVADDYDSEAVLTTVQELGGADAVFASRVLHHAPKPAASIAALRRLLAPHGVLLVIDYQPHGDERMREQQADLWLGFEASELSELAEAAGLDDVVVTPIPAARCGDGPDGHIDWQVLTARAPGDRARQ